MAKKKFNLFENEVLEVSEIFKQKNKHEKEILKEEKKEKELILKEKEEEYLKKTFKEKFNSSNQDIISGNEIRGELLIDNKENVIEIVEKNKSKYKKLYVIALIVNFSVMTYAITGLLSNSGTEKEKIKDIQIITNSETIKKENSDKNTPIQYHKYTQKEINDLNKKSTPNSVIPIEKSIKIVEVKPKIEVKIKNDKNIQNYNNLTKIQYQDLMDKIEKENKEREKNQIVLDTIKLFKNSYFVDNNDFESARQLFNSYDNKSNIKTLDPELEKIFLKLRKNIKTIGEVNKLYNEIQSIVGINKIFVSYNYSYGIKKLKHPEFSSIHFKNILNDTDYDISFDEIKSIEVKNNGIEIYSNKLKESIEILNKEPNKLKEDLLLLAKELKNYDNLEYAKKFDRNN